MLIKLYCDNIAHNPVQHDKTKHIEVDRHFIKENLDGGLICMPYIPTIEQLVDVFTKGLRKGQFNSITFKLGMNDIFEPT